MEIITIVMLYINGFDIHFDQKGLDEVRPIVQYYDRKHECDIRSGGRIFDNYYVSNCDGFYLVFDTDKISWYRIRNSEILFHKCGDALSSER